MKSKILALILAGILGACASAPPPATSSAVVTTVPAATSIYGEVVERPRSKEPLTKETADELYCKEHSPTPTGRARSGVAATIIAAVVPVVFSAIIDGISEKVDEVVKSYAKQMSASGSADVPARGSSNPRDVCLVVTSDESESSDKNVAFAVLWISAAGGRTDALSVQALYWDPEFARPKRGNGSKATATISVKPRYFEAAKATTGEEVVLAVHRLPSLPSEARALKAGRDNAPVVLIPAPTPLDSVSTALVEFTTTIAVASEVPAELKAAQTLLSGVGADEDLPKAIATAVQDRILDDEDEEDADAE